MDRRAFVTGLFGVAGAVTMVSFIPRVATAAPIARALEMPLPEPRPQAAASGARAPDGTPVELAWHRPWHRPRWARRRWRRRSRLVCRSYVNRWGRWVRRCRRVWW